MFDNLRDSSFYEEEEPNNNLYVEPAAQPAVGRRRRRSNGRFLGMTSQQRFLLSVMFLFTVCVVGVLVMMVLGRMSLF